MALAQAASGGVSGPGLCLFAQQAGSVGCVAVVVQRKLPLMMSQLPRSARAQSHAWMMDKSGGRCAFVARLIRDSVQSLGRAGASSSSLWCVSKEAICRCLGFHPLMIEVL